MNRLVLRRELEDLEKVERDECIFGLLEPLGLYTIERPWVPSAPGGKPFESCVPAGIYKLSEHIRADGSRVPVLINPGLAVFHRPGDRPNKVGRYFVLIHIANWVHDIVGCIGVGMARASSGQGPMVTKSADAMKILMDYIHNLNWEIELEIVGENSYGTGE